MGEPVDIARAVLFPAGDRKTACVSIRITN